MFLSFFRYGYGCVVPICVCFPFQPSFYNIVKLLITCVSLFGVYSQARRNSFHQIMSSRTWIGTKVEPIFAQRTTAWDKRLRVKLHYTSYVSKYLMFCSHFTKLPDRSSRHTGNDGMEIKSREQ